MSGYEDELYKRNLTTDDKEISAIRQQLTSAHEEIRVLREALESTRVDLKEHLDACGSCSVGFCVCGHTATLNKIDEALTGADK